VRLPIRAGPPHAAADGDCSGRTRTRLSGTGAESPTAAGLGCSDRPAALRFRRCLRRVGAPVRLRRARHRPRIVLANDRARRWRSASRVGRIRARLAARQCHAPGGAPRRKVPWPPALRRRSLQPSLPLRRPLPSAARPAQGPPADHAPRPDGAGDRPNRCRAEANCCGSPGSIGPRAVATGQQALRQPPQRLFTKPRQSVKVEWVKIVVGQKHGRTGSAALNDPQSNTTQAQTQRNRTWSLSLHR